ncbi:MULTISPECIES: hypothetical protein [Streptomyces]|uniref:Uncharacterized protein n=2 Tax=Streptomyces TaxID=1883 RepID=A0A291SPW8_STRMQ|nr:MULTISPECIES: hypothetical protein [Streptomyces]AQA11894.1 hypothetical protein BV401_16875 [Streptomyces autolyticus]ATL82897.1 secreted protein [Streptomyces malaysiensis]MCM3809079.1 hypothetical protein [Streptomyces sp. DR7-3]NIY65456.1 hypothetical protein [Streptomyces malaysiensis]PNG97421.1 hypothetical protein SMF913_13446 [Streptomyces malaysiensis]
MSHAPTTGRAAPPPAPAAPPRTAWSEGLDRARAAATTEPGRLRVIGAVLAALVVAFGAVTAWQVSDRQTAADAVAERSQPLSADAAQIYRSLADADTTATGGFLAGGQEPIKVRQRYERDIDTASKLLVRAAANTEGSSSARDEIQKINQLLPVYTGLVDSARANNRQGLPLGGAYLRYANDTMRDRLLPAAGRLYKAETARLGEDYEDAEAWPWVAIATGLVALGALGWAQRREYQRTNRVLNHGLLAATAAATVVMLWLVVGHAVASTDLSDSNDHGAKSLQVLNEARIDSLRARADENLTLVARGAVVVDEDGADKGKDAYDVSYGSRMSALVGKASGDEPAEDSLLDKARALADDDAGREPVKKAGERIREWQVRHKAARAADDGGDYKTALAKIIGSKDSTGESFDAVDSQLAKALDHEQREFQQAADDGRGAFTAMPLGAGVLAFLGAAGAVLGIGRRLSEYR